MTIVQLATRRRVTIAMFTVAVLLFGTVSLSRLNLNLLPDLAYPTLTIRTAYTGAAPVEMENLISKPIEEALGVVKHVQEVRSVSRTGQSDVVLQFAWGTDMDFASLDVREKLDAISLPLEAERPVILRFDPALDPIMRYGLTYDVEAVPAPVADNLTPTVQASSTDESRAGVEGGSAEERLKRLRRFADEQLKKELESALGVAAVKISGGLEDEVQVLLDQEKIAQLGLTPEQISQVLRAENVNLSGGRLEQGVQQFLVRTVNQFESVAEMNSVIVSQREGRPIYLRDVATVRLGYKEREAITRINGVEAVEVAIYKEGDANTVAVADAIENRQTYIAGMMPEGMALVKVYDQSTFIRQAIDEVVQAGLIGGLLAVLVLFFFLRDFGTTLIISLSIPVSVIATFNLMYGADLSLNIMSLGGLALGIGLLVDNSIVVLENIARYRDQGLSRLDAAQQGAGEVGQAVVASTLTTIAVFFPLVFVEGIAGQLFRDQALTVTFSLLASLIVAITLIPMLASFGSTRSESPSMPFFTRPARNKPTGWLRRGLFFLFITLPFALARGVYVLVGAAGTLLYWLFRPFTYAFNAFYDLLAASYPKLLGRVLRMKAIVLVVAFGLFGGSMLLVPYLGAEFIPQMAQGEFEVEFRLPPGTPLEQTDKVLAEVQRSAASQPLIEHAFAVAGTGNRMDANPDQGGENWGEMHVALVDGAGDAEEAIATAGLRDALAKQPGVTYKFGRPTLFSFDTPVVVEVSGFDLDDLKRVGQALAQRLERSDRFADVKSSMEQGHPEVQIHFDRERAAALGLAVHDLANRVVNTVRGDIATRYSWHDRKIDVVVRLKEEDRASINKVRQLIVNPESERPVPLSAVAEVVESIGPGEIRRIGQQRVAIVSANLRYGDLSAASTELDQAIAGIALPSGISVQQGGQREEMDNSFRSLLFALALAVFLVYLVMASQFESLLHPFVIFFSIPLALIGAVWALWLTNSTLSVVVFIGLILLAGIVVNNAIVLVDLINQLRQQGMVKVEAIIEGGRLRLRPILMTTLTTALGLLPLAIGFGEGAEIRAPMAITVIGGLVVSTLLTLVVIPVMYAVLDRTA